MSNDQSRLPLATDRFGSSSVFRDGQQSAKADFRDRSFNAWMSC